MEKDHDNYVFSMNVGESLTVDDFNVEFFEYNQELYCEGNPIRVVKNFDELINLLDEWE
ncbi:hypothetical protein [Pseudoneobacillus rhizosphaerae]|uniref:Uncharacterized protein n=1 Tax=Pseudoneobacillus rhizosphaerae TaxID=2880968 RepID=A0A9C7G5W7_9BACI|nr:hypothetical protein [Pseudoneobacillus rhizosphaerae]CAG9606409.1 hypothetical protein NEOCIP111885_00097 [Pseudoneobacillus rhizosphaerae]